MVKKYSYLPPQRNFDEDGRPRSRRVAPKAPEQTIPRQILGPTPVVIFMASSTPEKIRDFRLIAETKQLPIIFEDIHKIIGAFHSVDEDEQDIKENALKKLSAIDIGQFRSGKHAARIADYLKERDIPANAHVYFATEDGGVSFEQAIWDKVDKSGISDEVLARIKPKGRFGGPAVETGPVLSSAMGSHTLMERVSDAIDQTDRGQAPVPMREDITVTLASLNARATDAPEVFNVSRTHYFHRPNKAKIEAMLPHQKVSSYYYMRPQNQPGKSIAELGAEGIAQHSVRAKAVDAIYEHFFGITKHVYKHEFRERNLGSEAYRVGAFGADSGSLLSKLHSIFSGHGLYKDYFAHVPQSEYVTEASRSSPNAAPGAYEILANIEDVIKDSDAAVLFPDMRHLGAQPTELQELLKLYTLFSLEVNKQLNPRDAEKPVYILNHDGSWDKALAIHNDLTNCGMTKEYNISIPPRAAQQVKQVSIRSNSYYDVIGDKESGVTYEATTDALVKLLAEKRKGYTRRTTKPDKEIEHGMRPENFEGFKVAMFCSAGNENVQLNNAVKQISYELVKEDFGIVYGGGDRYTMGAVLDGVRQYRQELKAENDQLDDEYLRYKAWVAGYSTKQILKSETKFGRFSEDLSYTKQTRDIYQRMADMLEHSDAVVAAPGGAGTVQEWVAAMILNKTHPEHTKPIVFFNPPLNSEQYQVWNTALKMTLGEKDYKLLTDKDTPAELREKRSQELGIYVETTEDAVKSRLLELRRQHKAAKGHVAVAAAAPAEGHALH